MMNAAGYSPISPFFRVCDGVRIRFADNEADSSAVTVLMLSPWPESLWAFRRIWDQVSGAARVVAIDLPGFGHSDGRPELIAPDAMGTFLARLIEDGAWARRTWSVRTWAPPPRCSWRPMLQTALRA